MGRVEIMEEVRLHYQGLYPEWRVAWIQSPKYPRVWSIVGYEPHDEGRPINYIFATVDFRLDDPRLLEGMKLLDETKEETRYIGPPICNGCKTPVKEDSDTAYEGIEMITYHLECLAKKKGFIKSNPESDAANGR